MSKRNLATLTGVVSLLITAGCNSGSDSEQLAVNAGADLQVGGLAHVTLHGKGSADHGAQLTYQWTQTGGAPVALLNANTPAPSFVAPNTSSTLTFRLTVTEVGHQNQEADEMHVHVASTLPKYDWQLLSSTKIAGGGTDRALHSVYDPDTRRLFVVDATDKTIEVLGLDDPAQPQWVGSLDLAAAAGPFAIGEPTGIALSRHMVAVSIEADPLQHAGLLELWDTTHLVPLGYYPVGAAPRSVVFTPDGTRVLTVNEGDPSADFLVDPEGTVSIVHLSWHAGLPQGQSGIVERLGKVPGGTEHLGGVAWTSVVPATELADMSAGPALPGAGVDVPFDHRVKMVTTVDFEAFNPLLDELVASGVRILGPHSTVAEDLEPVSIALNAAGTLGWVMCEENNAMALLDLVHEEFVEVRALGYKSWDDPLALRSAEPVFHAWNDPPLLEKIAKGVTTELGGFAGLAWAGEDGGVLHFWAIPDRGPTLPQVQANGDAELETPFALPQYGARLVELSLDPLTSKVKLESEIALKRSDEFTPISGLPNLLGTIEGLAFHDSQPIDLNGAALPLDPFGADFGSVVRLPNGQFLLGDRYRPSLYTFDAVGTLVKRYVPAGSNGFGEYLGEETLPAVYAQRRAGTGFDGVAFDESTGKAYAFMGSPLDNPDDAQNTAALQSRIARIVEFELPGGVVTGEYVYVLDGPAARIAEAAWAGQPGAFLVLEVNDAVGAAARNVVQRIVLEKATNLSELPAVDYAAIAGPGGVLELTAACDLADLVPAIVPVHKDVWTDLAAGGVTNQTELQGFVPIDASSLLLASDDEFGLHDAVLVLNPGKKKGVVHVPDVVQRTQFTLVQCPPMGLDASDADEGISIHDWPVRGMFMPDAVVQYDCDGFSYLLTANEGQPRDHVASHGVVEEQRVAALQLDPSVFPDAAYLQQPGNLGRLHVSSLCGDSDADGYYEELWSFGGRSFSVWSLEGEMVYDSGDTLERMEAFQHPDLFNSEGTPAKFDTCSDDRGAEPKSLAVGQVNGTPYVFVGLEQFCGAMVFDLSIPSSPSFACFLLSPQDRGAHGLVFVEAGKSPTGQPLLVSTNSLTGSVAVFELDF